MSSIEILEHIRRLPAPEQHEVAKRVLAEFGGFDDELTPEQIEEFELRADRLCRNPEKGITWEQVRAELPERLKNRKCAVK